MKKNRQRDTLYYWLSSIFIFSTSYFLLAHFIIDKNNTGILFLSLSAVLGIIDVGFVESSWDIYRLSRMNIAARWLFRTFWYSGILVLFVSVENKHSIEWPQFLLSWMILIAVGMILKMILLTWSSHRLKNNRINYRTLFIGSGEKSHQILDQLMDTHPSIGQSFVGILSNTPFRHTIPFLGMISDLPQILVSHDIEEVTIALDRKDIRQLEELLNELRSSVKPLLIRLTPESYDILMGRVKLDALYGTPLIELPSGKLQLWQLIVKRIADVLMSSILLVFLSPLILYIILRIKMDSRGSIFYRQHRIGRYGVPFTIFKFRSMYEDSESEGPQLSFEGDQRCTPWGGKMRKWRLDEIPQFVNVILGEMSIVGPRPERKYFIDQIKSIAPYYSRILTVRPGITSWGQVKYGYASNLNQMVERLQFDLIYVENLSLQLDIKIILYTILVLFQGKGK